MPLPDGKSDVVVLEEKDETLYLNLSKSKSSEYIFVNHGYTDNMEVHFLKADDPSGAFQVIRPKEKDFFYEAEHRGDKFIIRTNWNARILPVRVLGKCGGTVADIVDGMSWSAGINVPGVPKGPSLP